MFPAVMGFISAKQRNFQAHAVWMYRLVGAMWGGFSIFFIFYFYFYHFLFLLFFFPPFNKMAHFFSVFLKLIGFFE